MKAASGAGGAGAFEEHFVDAMHLGALGHGTRRHHCFGETRDGAATGAHEVGMNDVAAGSCLETPDVITKVRPGHQTSPRQVHEVAIDSGAVKALVLHQFDDLSMGERPTCGAKGDEAGATGGSPLEARIADAGLQSGEVADDGFSASGCQRGGRRGTGRGWSFGHTRSGAHLQWCNPVDCCNTILNKQGVLPVVLGLLALVVGPILGPLLRRSLRAMAVVDSFVIVTVCGLVLIHVLPQSVALAGPIALPLATLGLLAPALLHRLDATQPTGNVAAVRGVVVMAVMLGGAFLHALLDGVALVDEDAAHGVVSMTDGIHLAGEHAAHAATPTGHAEHTESLSVLAIAVLLHRIPYGLAIWMVGRERYGRRRALAMLGALALGTVVGSQLGASLLVYGAEAFALVQVFAAGAVLHVLLESPVIALDRAPRASFVGVVLGILTLVTLAETHPVVAIVDNELQFARAFMTIALQTAPSLVVAFVIMGVLGVVGPRLRVPLKATGARAAQALSGVLAGAPWPLCSCSVVLLFEGLVRRRAGVAAAVAFLVSAPELGMPSALLSGELLGLRLTAIRLLGAVLVAVVAGVVVAAVAPSTPTPAADAQLDEPGQGFLASLMAAIDHVIPWVLVGLLIAACCEPLLTTTTLLAIPKAIEVPLYGIVGVPLYVCGSGSTPLAAVLLHKGASAGAVLAFLLSGPATNVATLGLLWRLFSARVAVAFGATVFVASALLGIGVNLAVDGGLGVAVDLAVPSLHQEAIHDHGVLEVGALAVVVALLLWSLARQGLRGFLRQIVHPLDNAKGGHVHGPHCGHTEHARVSFVRRAPVARIQLDLPPVSSASSAGSSTDSASEASASGGAPHR